MRVQQGSPAWYLEGGEDLFQGRVETDTAKAVVEEARGMIFRGQSPEAVRKTFEVRGAGKRSYAIIARASALEWNAIVEAASTDVEAGQTSSQNVDLARRLAVEIIRNDPTGANFAAKLAAHGASEALANFLSSDKTVTRAGHSKGWWSLIGGVVALLVGIGIIVSESSAGADPPAQVWFILAVGAGGVLTGLSSLLRR